MSSWSCRVRVADAGGTIETVKRIPDRGATAPKGSASADETPSRADATRQQILRAASRRFARCPYHDVGLNDILAEAGLTKGAMYFHFPSKHALALAVVEEQLKLNDVAVQDLLDRNLSGLETLIDIGYLMAVRDITQDAGRAVLNLLPVVGQDEELQARLLAEWTQTPTLVVESAVAEGDVIADRDPQDVVRTFMSLYLGLRQVGDLNGPERFLLEIEKGWNLVLPGIVPADRLPYFSQFIRRRTALAVRTVSARGGPVDLADSCDR
jgi:AcrR family transcriptional regulator